MKTARRQELKTNDLAQSLEDFREFLRNHGSYVVGAVVVVALVVLAYVYNTRSTQQATRDATQQMRSLPFDTDDNVRDSVKKLADLAADTKDDALVLESLRRRAQISMSRAHAAEDGTPSAEFLDLAMDAYQQILDRFGSNPVDFGMALFGLATIEEDRFVLDNDPAHKENVRGYLERVRDNEPLTGTPFQTVALERINALDRTFVTVAMNVGIVAPPIGPPLLGQGPATTPGAASPPPTDTLGAAGKQTVVPAPIESPPDTPETVAAQPAKAPPTAASQAGPKKDKKGKIKRGRRRAPKLRPVGPDEVPLEVREQLERRMDKLEEQERQKREAKEAKKKAKKKAKPADDSKQDDDQEPSASDDENDDDQAGNDSTDDQAADDSEDGGDK